MEPGELALLPSFQLPPPLLFPPIIKVPLLLNFFNIPKLLLCPVPNVPDALRNATDGKGGDKVKGECGTIAGDRILAFENCRELLGEENVEVVVDSKGETGGAKVNISSLI